MLAVADGGGIGEADLRSWIFGTYAFGGALSILFSLLQRQPIAIAWTIPGMVLLAGSLDHLSLEEVVGAYLATGVLICVLGLTGWVGRVMALVPTPIVMGMVAGVFLPFGLAIPEAFGQSVWLALAMVGSFVVVAALPRLARAVPPVLAALAAGALVLAFGDEVVWPATLAWEPAAPKFYLPAFSAQAMVELVIPLTVTVVAIQNAQGFLVLRQAGYVPAVDRLTVACGVGSLANALVGAVSACVTGPANALLNVSGAPERRYWAGVTFGVLMVAFGIFSPLTTQLGLALPTVFVLLLGGLALLNVLRDSFTLAFGGHFRMGALIAFITTMSDVTLLNIGGAFWGLIFGWLASRLLEPTDFEAPEPRT